jgi:hypothetical protein
MELRHRRADQQNPIGPRERTSDLMKEAVFVIRMIASSRVHVFGMAMDVMVG